MSNQKEPDAEEERLSEQMEDVPDSSETRRLDSGIDSSVVATVMSVADAKINTKFNKRHNFDYTYEPLEDPTEFYFDEDGARHIDQLTKAGKVQLGTTCSDPEKPIFVHPEDDSKAREERISRFEDAAQSRLIPTDGDLDIDPVLLEDEEIVCTLDCTDVIGIPSTTDEVVFRGEITVSLIKSKEGGSRLFFHVSECSYMSSYRERFNEYEKAVSCVCCFIPCEMGSNKASSSARMEYRSKKLYNSQFFTLPIRPCLVDSVCFRSSVNDFQAATTSANTGVDEKEGCPDCCTLVCSCCKACDCKLPMCCGMTSVEGERHAYFSLREYFMMGQQPAKLDHVVDQPTEEIAGTTWTINAANDDNVYVVLHYRSLLDNENHECKMRLAKGDAPNVAFRNAKKFVSHLGFDRNKDRWDYFHNRPTTSFSAFDTADNELVANSHLGRTAVAAGAAVTGVCGALCSPLRFCFLGFAKKHMPCLHSICLTCPKLCPGSSTGGAVCCKCNI